MRSTCLKKFDATYVLTVGDLCTRVITSWSRHTALHTLHPLLTEWEHAWVLVHNEDEHRIVGAVRTQTLKTLQQQTLEQQTHEQQTHDQQTLGEVVETEVPTIVETTPWKRLSDDGQIDQWHQHPIRIVTNTSGIAIGYLDESTFSKIQTRHLLNETAQNRLREHFWIAKVASIARELDVHVYLIGGWVRDFILDTPSTDLDFAVEGDVVSLVSTLVDHFGGSSHTFTSFGGVHWVISESLTLDFTECRKEHYPSLAALPIVSRTHIDGDLKRRDFNINAMAIALTGLHFGLFIDPFTGLESLESKEIHSLHPLSFLDDPTRIFRASRYCARFDMTLSPNTTTQLQHALSTIQPQAMLTVQRIGIELEKIFKEPTPSHAWKLLQEWAVWKQWQPHWNAISLHNTTTLSIQPTREEWTTCWWMQLCLALPMEERLNWKSIVSIRSNGLKLWISTPAHIKKMAQALSNIEISNPEVYIQTGLILQRSTLLQWLLIEINHPELLELLHWWIDIGRHRNRVTTGTDLLTLNVAKGPMMAELLQVAQNVAWSGGTAESEKVAIQSHIQRKKSSS